MNAVPARAPALTWELLVLFFADQLAQWLSVPQLAASRGRHGPAVHSWQGCHVSTRMLPNRRIRMSARHGHLCSTCSSVPRSSRHSTAHRRACQHAALPGTTCTRPYAVCDVPDEVPAGSNTTHSRPGISNDDNMVRDPIVLPPPRCSDHAVLKFGICCYLVNGPSTTQVSSPPRKL